MQFRIPYSLYSELSRVNISHVIMVAYAVHYASIILFHTAGSWETTQAPDLDEHDKKQQKCFSREVFEDMKLLADKVMLLYPSAVRLMYSLLAARCLFQNDCFLL